MIAPGFSRISIPHLAVSSVPDPILLFHDLADFSIDHSLFRGTSAQYS
jgi:hypothetical protein